MFPPAVIWKSYVDKHGYSKKLAVYVGGLPFFLVTVISLSLHTLRTYDIPPRWEVSPLGQRSKKIVGKKKEKQMLSVIQTYSQR